MSLSIMTLTFDMIVKVYIVLKAMACNSYRP